MFDFCCVSVQNAEPVLVGMNARQMLQAHRCIVGPVCIDRQTIMLHVSSAHKEHGPRNTQALLLSYVNPAL
jgi:hypothetical protein